MNTTNDSALRRKQIFEAMKVAEIQAEDGDATAEAVRDMCAFAEVSEDEARIVAASIKARVLPAKARMDGLSEKTIMSNIMPMLGGDSDPMTANFANEHGKHNDQGGFGGQGAGQSEGDPHGDFGGPDNSMSDDSQDGGMPGDDQSDFGDDAQNMDGLGGGMGGNASSMPMKDSQDDLSNDDASAGDDSFDGGTGEADDMGGQIATVELKIPTDKLDILKKLLDQAFGGGASDDSGDDAGDPGAGAPSFDDSGEDDSSDPSGDPSGGFGGGSDDGNLDSEEDDSSADGSDKPFGQGSTPAGGMSDKAPQIPSGKAAATQAARRTIMSNNDLAARRAHREAILAQVTGVRTAVDRGDSEQSVKPKDINLGKDTSQGTYGGVSPKPFQFADEAQYKGIEAYPTMTMENSDGNSLKEQNVKFNKQDIPTNNDDLQLNPYYNIVKKEGTPDGTLEYTVDFEKVDFIPASTEVSNERKEHFKIPTQEPQNNVDRKTTIAHTVNCMGCNNPRLAEVSKFECQDCFTKIAICGDCVSEGYCPSCAAIVTGQRTAQQNTEINFAKSNDDDKTTDENKTDNGESKRRKGRFDGTEMPQDKRDTGDPFGGEKKAAALYEARLAKAYEVSYRLAMANILDEDEVRENVKMWMDGGLSGRMMDTQGELMLRSASGSRERIASQANTNTRTASVGVSLNPTFGAVSSKSATDHMHDALDGLWTMPRLTEKELEKFNR